jgi:hypothetical protein
METMKFDSNNREHKLVADDLGLLLKMIDTGNIYKFALEKTELRYHTTSQLRRGGRGPRSLIAKSDFAVSPRGKATRAQDRQWTGG